MSEAPIHPTPPRKKDAPKEPDAYRKVLVARRVRGGGNPAESERLLDELLANYRGDNLAFALHYNGFATTRQADQAAAAFTPESKEN
ncbi:MAG TPA: hypothetical protein VFU07_05380 [Candidatus Lumbricidophila sp.]|nr:hypothetical protein [Candidatus Lumbricidophila sp.]